MIELVNKLNDEKILTKAEFVRLIDCDKSTQEYLMEVAEKTRIENYGNDIYLISI